MAVLARFAAALGRCGVRPGDQVAVALSGGPDSLALAALTSQWHRQQPAADRSQAPLALIVDHRLRPESSEEAAAVAAQAVQLGLAPHVLPVAWPGGSLPRPGAKMPAARQARYALLLAACAAAGGRHLLLAHHADDQAETFLLRLLHASGVAGLACMPAAVERRTEHGPVSLARPLLGFRKVELEAVCRQRGLPFVVDPTNADLSFQRNRIRHLLHRCPLPPEGSVGSNSPGTRQAARAARTDDSTGCGNGTSTIVDDLLLLQRRCEAVARQQDAAVAELLEQAVLLTSCTSLLRRHRQAGSRQVCQPQQQQQQPHSTQQCVQQQGHVHGSDAQRWPCTQQLQSALEHLRYALIDAGCLARTEEPVAVAGLSAILQSVSGQPYPPGLAQVSRLHAFLQCARPGSSFTGGGCLVRCLGRSWGRHALCVALADQEAAEAALAAAAKLERPRQAPTSSSQL